MWRAIVTLHIEDKLTDAAMRNYFSAPFITVCYFIVFLLVPIHFYLLVCYFPGFSTSRLQQVH